MIRGKEWRGVGEDIGEVNGVGGDGYWREFGEGESVDESWEVTVDEGKLVEDC